MPTTRRSAPTASRCSTPLTGCSGHLRTLRRSSCQEHPARDRKQRGARGMNERIRDEQVPGLRRYTLIVTVTLILTCNAILLLGIWGSGVNLDSIFRTPDIFNPSKDVCLRLSWHKVAGIAQP